MIQHLGTDTDKLMSAIIIKMRKAIFISYVRQIMLAISCNARADTYRIFYVKLILLINKSSRQNYVRIQSLE